MAANWRHLSRVLSGKWVSTTCRFHQAALESRGCSVARGHPVLCSSTTVSTVCPWTTHRHVSTNTVDTAEPAPGHLTKFWRWFNDDVEEEVMSDSEAQERHALLQKVQEMYFAKPPVNPGLDFYKEVFKSLTKYNDGLGVATLWNSMSEMKVVPDEELTTLIKPFLEESRRRSWFE